MAASAALAETGVVGAEPMAWTDSDDIDEPEPYDDPVKGNWLISGTVFLATAAIAALASGGAYVYFRNDRTETPPATERVGTPSTTLVATATPPANTRPSPTLAKLSVVDEEYLADIYSQGLPVSDINRSSLMQIGHETCTTAKKFPTMQIVDLALTISDKRTAYPYDKARIIATSALDHYCPQARPTGAPVVAKTAPNYDQVFVDNMRARNWVIVDPTVMAEHAHYTCLLLNEGNSREFVQQMYAQQTGNDPADAAVFVGTVMSTYPNCPAR
ncbi:hypothetical protein CCUG60885_02195 [Mycobacteroides salmoniphilum]|uniref:DUF732 domain-containing protein n=2 Tax=Mycobacteroides salmoniphilum TaxID=404941 RepID=A0A4R8SGQ2_9MYCO|nr:hypothetical protein CCUG60885_02195 [Mycobacteroides salmoniphilum]TEA05154.1 hypothetical protein CCUG60883_02454 [Mycobacteroides salmoniphilum]